MSEVLQVLQLAIAVGFALLGARIVLSWFRHLDRRHGYLALAMGSLALVVLIAPALGSGISGQPLTDRRSGLFLPSGSPGGMFRASFPPRAGGPRRWIVAAVVLVGLL